ncbi:hypothetical protein D3C77_309400 [compost metagenome]
MYGHAQVVLGKALKVLAGFEQRAQHAAGDKAPAQHGEQQGDHDQCQAQQLGSAQAALGFKHDLLAALAQGRHQLLAQGLHAGHGVTSLGVDDEVALQVVLPGRLALPGDGLGVFAEGVLQVDGEGFECRVLGITDQLVEQAAAVVDQLCGQRHAFVGAVVVAATLFDKAGGDVGAGADRHQQGVVQTVRLARGEVQFSDLLIATHRRAPGTDGGEQQGQAEQRQHPEHSGANFQVGEHAGSTPFNCYQHHAVPSNRRWVVCYRSLPGWT